MSKRQIEREGYKMTGEHFSSATGKELDKKKDPYVRFKWEGKKRVKKAVATILEKEKIVKDMDLSKMLEDYYGGVEDLCVICGFDPEWPLVRFEFYNWKKAKTEKETFAHIKCLEDKPIKAKLDTLRMLGKNPIFNIALNCLSVEKCGFFSKASDFRNCEHIVLRFEEETEHNPDGMVSIHMRPLLYCKRAHPGQFSLETEADTWWNIEHAGLALIAKRITEALESPEAKAAFEALKKQHPLLVEGLRKIIRENPIGFAQATAFGAIAETYILEKTPLEIWETEILTGNDYY